MVDEPHSLSRNDEEVSDAQRVAERLRDELISRLQPGDGVPAQRALARQLGVSKTTVLRALNRLVHSGWLSRPRGSRDYVVVRPPASLTRTSAFISSISGEHLLWYDYCRSTYIGAWRQAYIVDRGILPVLDMAIRCDHRRFSLLWSPALRAVDSCIAVDVFDRQILRQLSRHVPVVCLDAPCDLPNVSWAVGDHRMSLRMAFKHLVDFGHRRIGFIIGPFNPRDPAASARIEAYRDCFAWLDLPRDPGWEAILTDGHAFDQLHSLIESLRDEPPSQRPTAFIVVGVALMTLLELTTADIRVPEQVSLVTIGDAGLLADWAHFSTMPTYFSRAMILKLGLDRDAPLWNLPADLAAMPLTCVTIPFEQMGRWAIDEIERRVKDRKAPAEHREFAPIFIPGRTTAAAAT